MKAFLGFSLILCSCFSTKAALDPYAYAPQKPQSLWKMHALAQKLNLKEEIPEGNLALLDMIDIALRNNPETRMSWAEARLAAAQFGQAQSPDLPTLNSSYAYARTRGAVTAASGYDSPVLDPYYLSSWGPQLQLSYTLLDFGSAKANAHAMKQLLYKAGFAHNRQVQTVIRTVAQNYYDHLYQKDLLKAYEEDLETATTTFNAAQTSFDAGIKNKFDYLQAKSQLIQAQMQWVEQQQRIVESYTTLASSMGVDAQKKLQFSPVEQILPSPELAKTIEDILDNALCYRADILSLESEVKAQEYAISSIYRSFFPTLSYSLNFGQTSYTEVGSDKYDFTSVFSLNFPLFSGFSTLNSLKMAQAKKEQAEARLRKQQLAVVQEITNAHHEVSTSHENLTYGRQFLENAKQQYSITLAEYEAGTGSILEVVSSQENLAQARAKLALAYKTWLFALVNLSYASGSLDATYE